MKKIIYLLLICTLIMGLKYASQGQGNSSTIKSGITWLDDKGLTVSAHGACIIQERNRYYLFGEKHFDNSNAFAGVNCYSSADLCHWKNEGTALAVQDSGRLSKDRAGERPKVMKCPKTEEYVMYLHTDNLTYKDQCVGYATAKTITGPYEFKGPILFNGNPIKKWDMGTFQDVDGRGYILIHGGEIYELSDDYHSVVSQVNKNMTAGFESPALFRKGSTYYFLGSHLTSWERNDNYYYTATSLRGPWTARGIIAPEGTLTWNSQTTFVLPIIGKTDTTYMYMGDRWSFPLQASAATYVWQPLKVSSTSLSLPTYHEEWKLDVNTGIYSVKKAVAKTLTFLDKKTITYEGNWNIKTIDTLTMMATDTKEAVCKIKFRGRQVSLYSILTPDGGYAKVTLFNESGKILTTTIVDMYCKYATSSLIFCSPILKRGKYTLDIMVMGEHSNWSDKRKANYGSVGNTVSVEKIWIR